MSRVPPCPAYKPKSQACQMKLASNWWTTAHPSCDLTHLNTFSWPRFRLCSSLVDHFPVEVLSQLLSPLLSPAYRCTSAFRGVSLPDVVSLEQALALGPAQRRGFLANLAQSFIDATSEKMTAAGRAATFAQATCRSCRDFMSFGSFYIYFIIYIYIYILIYIYTYNIIYIYIYIMYTMCVCTYIS